MKISEERALNRVAMYCSKAERCESEVRRKLVNWELTTEEQNRILKRLKTEKYIDHSRYSKSFIHDKFKYSKWGQKKIVYELRKKQIDETDYMPYLEDLSKDDFAEQLLHILKIKNRSTKAKDEYDRRNKLMRFGLSRGFSMDLVIKCVDQLLSGNHNEEV